MNLDSNIVRIIPEPHQTRVVMTQPDGRQILKARLGPRGRCHRWAARTLLEGLSLWEQHRLRVVVSAEYEETWFSWDLVDPLGMGLSTVHYDIEVASQRREKRRDIRLADAMSPILVAGDLGGVR